MNHPATSALPEPDAPRWLPAIGRGFRLCWNCFLISMFILVVCYNVAAYRSYAKADRLLLQVESQTGVPQRHSAPLHPGMILTTVLTAIGVGRVVCNRKAWQ